MNIDLRPFCSTDPTRPIMAQPWSRDGFTFATDARILIRVAVPPSGGPPGHPNAPGMNAKDFPFTHDHIHPSLWLPIPSDLPDPKLIACGTCAGTGYLPTEPQTSNLNPEPCDHCDGAKTWLEPTGVILGHQLISEIYLALIAKELPAPFLAPNAVKKEHAIPLKFTGGLGYLMPMHKKK